ncbi:MAG: hypothetical protein SGILL_006015, partial [Bacillariaceae sp.]
SFNKVNTAITDRQYPSPTSRKRRRGTSHDVSSDVEKKLQEIERNKKARSHATQRKAQQIQKQRKENSDDSDDDDSDIEDFRGLTQKKKGASQKLPPSKPPQAKRKFIPGDQEVVELLSSDEEDSKKKPVAKRAAAPRVGMPTRSSRSPRTAAAAQSVAAARSAAEMDTTLSSDDDSDAGVDGAVSRAHRLRANPLPTDVAAVFQRSRKARSDLVQAQHYHAHDLYVPVPEPDAPKFSRSGSSSLNQQSLSGIAKASMNLGKPLKVTCRTKLNIKGEEKECRDEAFTIRENEPLQLLFEMYIRTLRLPKTAKVTMTYGGKTLTKDATPKSFALKARCVIECTAEASYLVAANAASPSAAVFKSKKALGKLLKLSCHLHIRCKDPATRKPKKPLTTVLEIRESEKLSELMEPMRNAHKIPPNLKVEMIFEGERCEGKTPLEYDMESEDIVEFTVKVRHFMQRCCA